jgi:hypothetical protein
MQKLSSLVNGNAPKPKNPSKTSSPGLVLPASGHNLSYGHASLPGTDSEVALQDYRCECGKLLFRGLLLSGIVELKCKRCNTIKKFTFQP